MKKVENQSVVDLSQRLMAACDELSEELLKEQPKSGYKSILVIELNDAVVKSMAKEIKAICDSIVGLKKFNSRDYD